MPSAQILQGHSPAKPASDLLYVHRFAFERKARIASDHEQPFEPREGGYDLLNHSIRKIVLLGIAAYVLKRQHGDRRLVWEWWGRIQSIAQRGASTQSNRPRRRTRSPLIAFEPAALSQSTPND